MLQFNVTMQITAASEKEATAKAKAAKEIASKLTQSNIEYLASLSADDKAINKLLSNPLNRIGLSQKIKK
jgi:nickel-dependent lactate racemase